MGWGVYGYDALGGDDFLVRNVTHSGGMTFARLRLDDSSFDVLWSSVLCLTAPSKMSIKHIVSPDQTYVWVNCFANEAPHILLLSDGSEVQRFQTYAAENEATFLCFLADGVVLLGKDDYQDRTYIYMAYTLDLKSGAATSREVTRAQTSIPPYTCNQYFWKHVQSYGQDDVILGPQPLTTLSNWTAPPGVILLSNRMNQNVPALAFFGGSVVEIYSPQGRLIRNATMPSNTVLIADFLLSTVTQSSTSFLYSFYGVLDGRLRFQHNFSSPNGVGYTFDSKALHVDAKPYSPHRICVIDLSSGTLTGIAAVESSLSFSIFSENYVLAYNRTHLQTFAITGARCAPGYSPSPLHESDKPTHCLECPSGTFSSDGKKCTPCSVGSWCPKGSPRELPQASFEQVLDSTSLPPYSRETVLMTTSMLASFVADELAMSPWTWLVVFIPLGLFVLFAVGAVAVWLFRRCLPLAWALSRAWRTIVAAITSIIILIVFVTVFEAYESYEHYCEHLNLRAARGANLLRSTVALPLSDDMLPGETSLAAPMYDLSVQLLALQSPCDLAALAPNATVASKPMATDFTVEVDSVDGIPSCRVRCALRVPLNTSFVVPVDIIFSAAVWYGAAIVEASTPAINREAGRALRVFVRANCCSRGAQVLDIQHETSVGKVQNCGGEEDHWGGSAAVASPAVQAWTDSCETLRVQFHGTRSMSVFHQSRAVEPTELVLVLIVASFATLEFVRLFLELPVSAAHIVYRLIHCIRWRERPTTVTVALDDSLLPGDDIPLEEFGGRDQ